ncbi:hypothetical protein ACHAWF_013040 [Thalassiosira exigua]
MNPSPPLDPVNATFNTWRQESPSSAAVDQTMPPGTADTNDHLAGTTPPSYVEQLEMPPLPIGAPSSLVEGEAGPPSFMLEPSIRIPPPPERENTSSGQLIYPTIAPLLVASMGQNNRHAKAASSAASARLADWNGTDGPIAEGAKTNLPGLPDRDMDKPIAGSINGEKVPGVTRASTAKSTSKAKDGHNEKLPRTKSTGVDPWAEKFELLKQYKQENGHMNVPQKLPPLGNWVNKQRMEKRRLDKGESTSMTLQRRDLLNSVGFVWAEPKGQESWDRRFKELVAFKRQAGHCNFRTKGGDNPALGRWVTSQRSDKKKGKISEDNEKKLTGLGFEWERQDKPNKKKNPDV